MLKNIFLHTLNLVATEAGFSFRKRAFQGEFLRCSGRVAPALWLDIKYLRGLGHKFLCFFGIDVLDFEEQWIQYLASNGFNHDSADSMSPIVVHSHNYNLGMMTPYLRDGALGPEVDEMHRWMTLMFEHALRFPRSMEELVNVLTEGNLLGRDVFRHLGQPVKVRAFFLWLKHNGIVDLVHKLAPIPESRIWPYENIDVDNWCKLHKP